MTPENSPSANEFPEAAEKAIIITYRSVGLGVYGAVIRFAGMPLEKIALFMNSAQVSGDNQLRQAIQLTFKDCHTGKKSYMSPFKVVGPASVVAWFLQYSVMGMVFQVCDTALSKALGVPLMPYGAQLMEEPAKTKEGSSSPASTAKICAKIALAPALAGMVESTVANRAEVQRYFGLNKFSRIESALKWNPMGRLLGPAFLANASRNCIMSTTSFVLTPVLYQSYYPQEQKSKTSLFWFGLGVNIFIGNTVAITQQALWGRALDYASSGKVVARNIHYRTVIQDSLSTEGISAFFTVPKWASRVLMNAPVQGTLPWFYNEVLPLGEDSMLSAAKEMYLRLAKFLRKEDKNRPGYTYCTEKGS